ncbi:tetratricopeptide repeat protein [unidentified bacterial endosymbiont]|uniref:tetratricopeptide repeat protein n=1 Tax=unidentified bacterial endosymbiont TaxID=2355 RepID=UPI00209DB63B|nr:tetratricopeptide repeat protein [unidentified bacterial endosymbiont]
MLDPVVASGFGSSRELPLTANVSVYCSWPKNWARILDSVWSISYGELADAYQQFGYLYKAAELYEKAGRRAPSYVGHHLFSAAMLWEQLGKHERALSSCLTLFQLSPDNPSVVAVGLKLGKKLQDRSLEHFEAAYHQLQSSLRQEPLEYLSSN